VQNVQRTLDFSVDEITGHTVIKVTDSQTGDVIRQIPAQEVLAIMQELASRQAGRSGRGLLVSEQV